MWTEKRRVPMRLHRIDSCPATAVLLTFAKTKVSRANSAEALFFAGQQSRATAGKKRAKSIAGLSPACACEFLSEGPKRNQKVLSPDTRRCDEAASVPSAPRPIRHAAQTRCAQTWAALRPDRPPVLGSLYGSVRQQPTARATATAKPSRAKPSRAKAETTAAAKGAAKTNPKTRTAPQRGRSATHHTSDITPATTPAATTTTPETASRSSARRSPRSRTARSSACSRRP